MLAPPEGLRARGQGVIPRRFKRKKNFVTNTGTRNGWTDRRDGRNSYLDFVGLFNGILHVLTLLWEKQPNSYLWKIEGGVI